MYIKALDQLDVPLEELKKCDSTPASPTKREKAEFSEKCKIFTFCKSFSRSPKTSQKVRKSQEESCIVFSPQLYKSNHFGMSLKSNRIREIKNKGKIKQKIKDRVKEQLLELLKKNEEEIRSKSKQNEQRRETRSSAYKLGVSDFCANGQPHSNHLSLAIVPSKVDVKCMRNQKVLDLSALHESKQPGMARTSYQQVFLRRSSNFRQLQQANEQGAQMLTDCRRSMSSGRNRNRKLISWNKNYNKAVSHRQIKQIPENIQPWAVKQAEYDDDQIF